MVNVFEEALCAETPPSGQGGGGRSATVAPARLVAKVWVNNVAYDKSVWLDVDWLGRSGKPILTDTVALAYLEPAGGSGDFFTVDVPVNRATPAARRPKAYSLQYRIYYEVNGRVFTDGVCHQHHVAR